MAQDKTAEALFWADGAPGLVWAFKFDADGNATELTECDLPAERRAKKKQRWFWMHFNLADARVRPYLRERVSGLPAAAMDLLLSSGGHQQLRMQSNCVYGVMADFTYGLDGVTDDLAFLNFAGTGRLLITVRREGVHAAEAMRKALRSGRTVKTPGALMEGLFECVAEGVEDRAESLAGELAAVEEKLIVDEVGERPERLARARRLAVRLHRLLSTQRSLINRCEQQAWRAAEAGHVIDFGRLIPRFDWLDHEIVALRDRAHLLQEEVSLKMTDETNRNLQLLTIVTVVLLPASLVSSIFGMNVGGLPLEDSSAGFVWSILLLAGASGLVVWLLKRLGLLGR